MAPRVLVAGVGNIFLGDDGFGPEVLRRSAERVFNPAVRLVDYGIGGMHLAYELLDGWDALVLIDALPDRGSPGTVHVFEADHLAPGGTVALDGHGMDPAAVFASLRALGGVAPRTVVVGCEVADVGEGIGLSDPVRAAIPAALSAVESAVAMLLGGFAGLSSRVRSSGA